MVGLHCPPIQLSGSFSFRKRGCEGKDRSTSENNLYDPEWREVAWVTDDNYSFCTSLARPHYQEATSHLLGDCSKDNS